MRLALIGASGRVGRLIVEVLPEFANCELVAAVVSPTSRVKGLPVPGAISALAYSCDVLRAVERADVVVDFSRPETSVAVAQACAEFRKPCLIATTGQTVSQLADIEKASKWAAMAVVPNTSVGVFVTTQLAQLATRLLGDSVDIEIVELHHRGKKDAPSGTAKSIAVAINEERRLRPVVGREGARQADEIGIVSGRGGDVPGEHTIYFLGRGERIELTHRATDRAIFARGAIRIAEKLATMGPGLKGLADLF